MGGTDLYTKKDTNFSSHKSFNSASPDRKSLDMDLHLNKSHKNHNAAEDLGNKIGQNPNPQPIRIKHY